MYIPSPRPGDVGQCLEALADDVAGGSPSCHEPFHSAQEVPLTPHMRSSDLGSQMSIKLRLMFENPRVWSELIKREFSVEVWEEPARAGP